MNHEKILNKLYYEDLNFIGVNPLYQLAKKHDKTITKESDTRSKELWYYVAGILAIILLIFAGIFILTSIFGVCPLYLPFGISTRSKK